MKPRDSVFHFWGWMLFLICAVLFIVSSVRSDDPLLLAGSIVFLVACVVFLAPMVLRADFGRRRRGDRWPGSPVPPPDADRSGSAPTYEISDDPDRLDMDRIHRYLSEESYWATGRSREVVEASIRNSWCLGAYDGDGRLAGFARVVTDWATVYYLCDVFVLRPYRGCGLGKALVRRVVEDPRLSGLAGLLATQDAHGLYSRFGFRRGGEVAARVMRRPRTAEH